MGRPLKEIDGEQVYKLAQLGCSYREIAEKFQCSESTIRERFRAEKELGDACGKTAIRRWQMKRAQAGSDTMLTLLGKNRLGQTDKSEIKHASSVAMNLTPDLEAALAAFGYVKLGTPLGASEPSSLCSADESGPVDTGSSSSVGE